jgi:hypothetical protein
MFKSIIITAIFGWMAVLSGCQSCPIQKVENSKPEPENESTVIVDGAMQIRDWSRSVAYYQNGDTMAYPTLFLYQPHWNQPEYYYYFIETPLFIGQTIAMPIAAVITPPWVATRYTGVTVGSTYTAMPVLPPSMATAQPIAPPEPVPAPEQPQAPVEMQSTPTPTTQPS